MLLALAHPQLASLGASCRRRLRRRVVTQHRLEFERRPNLCRAARWQKTCVRLDRGLRVGYRSSGMAHAFIRGRAYGVALHSDRRCGRERRKSAARHSVIQVSWQRELRAHR
eukprot:scaffold16351_cov101-Phaeocystis_antarctica.AAC.1